MYTGFSIIDPKSFENNTIKLIGSDWMLISAGNQQNFNTMTASWGGMGFLWKRPVVFIFIRPHRYTFQFVEANDYFTIHFFGEEHRDILNFCGSHTGSEVDKILATGLRVFFSSKGNIYFEQSCLQMECRKIYFSDIDPDYFLDPDILKNYPDHDYHRMYFGAIEECIMKNSV